MRFTNWDVLLFPEDSRIPIQEFEVRCQALPQLLERTVSERLLSIADTHYQTSITHVPTLTCFISSLEYNRPFRVSIHSWEKPNPSDLLQIFRPVPEKVAFEAKVYIDGRLKAQRQLSLRNTWPEVIDTITTRDFVKTLRFPPFHTEILQQSHWDAGDSLGRIRIVISEGIAHPAGHADTSGFDKLREVVAFSFQHAPKHILEYSGIAWPNVRMFMSPKAGSTCSNFDAHAHSPRRAGSVVAQHDNQPTSKPTNFLASHPLHGRKWTPVEFKSGETSEDPFCGPSHDSLTHWQTVRHTDLSMEDVSARSKNLSEMSGVEMEQTGLRQRTSQTNMVGSIKLLTPSNRKLSTDTHPLSKQDVIRGEAAILRPVLGNPVPFMRGSEALSRPQSAFGPAIRPQSRGNRRPTSGHVGNMSWEETPTLGYLWSGLGSDHPELLPSLQSLNGRDRATSITSKRKRSLSPHALLPTEGDLRISATGMSTSPCKANSTPVKLGGNGDSLGTVISSSKS